MVPDALGLALDPEAGLASEARLLSARHEGEAAEAIVAAALDLYAGRIALVSSFGADSAVLLAMVADIDRSLPVIFLDTGKLFPATVAYRDALVEALGLTGVVTRQPDAADLAAVDPAGALWMADTDACCDIRKVKPLAAALQPYAAWISGRKRYQAATRAQLPLFEAADGRIKVNPLLGWDRARIEAYREARRLPPHPLVAEGYPSIGCLPCTDKVRPGEDERAGRWRGKAKTECGIHLDRPSGAVIAGI
ncbi:3'-phosphoadenosine 5'-phosphosulfate reductase [uncultured Pleomorphomonas sp.]|uniref:Adenosine 5'-phosphosulfate reductase n=1 Tax=uncultured Pleomorphomonas sp. TaxID=442121 RepID=A0A212LHS4_9HYPH|nr:phosphoadenylyl-sulfate reductase [uncultured Pleomorphomonas sp.]SCM77040.1 3'-phosphoadenosine 5'-phosphosulfate reductase [uncultured Pleomorphomonas sp.]